MKDFKRQFMLDQSLTEYARKRFLKIVLLKCRGDYNNVYLEQIEALRKQIADCFHLPSYFLDFVMSDSDKDGSFDITWTIPTTSKEVFLRRLKEDDIFHFFKSRNVVNISLEGNEYDFAGTEVKIVREKRVSAGPTQTGKEMKPLCPGHRTKFFTVCYLLSHTTFSVAVFNEMVCGLWGERET